MNQGYESTQIQVRSHPLLLGVPLYNTNSRRGYLSREASAKSPLPICDRVNVAQIAKILAVCDQKDTAPTLEHLHHQRGLSVILEPFEKAIDRWSTEMSRKVKICSI